MKSSRPGRKFALELRPAAYCWKKAASLRRLRLIRRIVVAPSRRAPESMPCFSKSKCKSLLGRTSALAHRTPIDLVLTCKSRSLEVGGRPRNERLLMTGRRSHDEIEAEQYPGTDT